MTAPEQAARQQAVQLTNKVKHTVAPPRAASTHSHALIPRLAFMPALQLLPAPLAAAAAPHHLSLYPDSSILLCTAVVPSDSFLHIGVDPNHQEPLAQGMSIGHLQGGEEEQAAAATRAAPPLSANNRVPPDRPQTWASRCILQQLWLRRDCVGVQAARWRRSCPLPSCWRTSACALSSLCLPRSWSERGGGAGCSWAAAAERPC